MNKTHLHFYLCVLCTIQYVRKWVLLQALSESGECHEALFKLGEINEDDDSVAAYDSLRARNRSGSPAKSVGDKYHGLSYWQFFRLILP